MPFMGQDWRSPGDMWVRTSEGWERMRLWRVKIFDNLNESVIARIFRLSHDDVETSKDMASRRQSFVAYNRGSSKEKSESNSLSEAMVCLDMCAAVKDIKRANFIAKMVLVILERKLPTLSGSSQKLVLNIIEAMVTEAIRTELNIGLMKDILGCAKDALNEGKLNHIGSQCLWERHIEMVNRLSDKLAIYQMKERNTDGRLMLSDLPPECLRVIFATIPDHKDVMRAGQTSSTMNQITEETRLWREMCLFHFTNKQILTFLPKKSENLDIDWKYIYKRCYKRYGKKDTYADMLAMCSHCSSIYWKSLGHPCISDSAPSESHLLTPEDFLHLFKV